MKITTFNRCLSENFPSYDFEGVWFDSFGRPATNATWFVYAPSGSGKTSFMVQLAYYMSRFCKVGYISAEEGQSLSFKQALTNNKPETATEPITLVSEPDGYDGLREILDTKYKVKFWIIDSIDYIGLTKTQVKDLISEYCTNAKRGQKYLKSFAMVGFADGNKPQTSAGNYMKYAAGIKVFVKDFIAEEINSRYGGNRQPFVINEKLAAERRGGEMIWNL